MVKCLHPWSLLTWCLIKPFSILSLWQPKTSPVKSPPLGNSSSFQTRKENHELTSFLPLLYSTSVGYNVILVVTFQGRFLYSYSTASSRIGGSRKVWPHPTQCLGVYIPCAPYILMSRRKERNAVSEWLSYNQKALTRLTHSGSSEKQLQSRAFQRAWTWG